MKRLSGGPSGGPQCVQMYARVRLVRSAVYTRLLRVLNEFPEAREQIGGVVRPRTRLRMVLHGEHWLGVMTNAFNGVVVEVDMRNSDPALAARRTVNRKIMVLRRDLDFPRS